MSYTAVFLLFLTDGTEMEFTESGDWIDGDACIEYVIKTKPEIPEINPHLDIDSIRGWCRDPEEIK